MSEASDRVEPSGHERLACKRRKIHEKQASHVIQQHGEGRDTTDQVQMDGRALRQPKFLRQ